MKKTFYFFKKQTVTSETSEVSGNFVLGRGRGGQWGKRKSCVRGLCTRFPEITSAVLTCNATRIIAFLSFLTLNYKIGNINMTSTCFLWFLSSPIPVLSGWISQFPNTSKTLRSEKKKCCFWSLLSISQKGGPSSDKEYDKIPGQICIDGHSG